MDINPALRALAAALSGDGPAVELEPVSSPDGAPGITLLPDGGSASDGRSGSDGGTHMAVVVSTSGSTGEPKRTILSADALAASSMATAIALGGEGQWLLALPVHYVAGIQVLVRSLFAGTRPWVMDLSAGFTAAAFTAAAAEMTDRIRYTSLVPTQLHRLLTDPAPGTLAALQRFDAVLLGGSPAAPALLETALGAGIKVVTTYGMSETCGGCVYDGVPLEGVQVAIRDGRIWLGGDVLASGYLHAPERTAESFYPGLPEPQAGTDWASRTSGGGAGGSPTRWYRTEDEGELTPDGKLTVLGRVDDVIITGGIKVSARLVADWLRLLPGVQDVFVAGLPDQQWGQRVSAAVVGSCTVEELRAAAHRMSEPYAVPKTVLFMTELPMLVTGKPDRQALLKALAAAKTTFTEE
ncbi:AMP-binding protein [Arthrobacter sp. H14-L1]|uniref:AMP-binding protein n=1 Tax=Arthrobacter sp. H14-L1 TaxID=2996697 RepID=UPI002271D4C4|nr:AMP-binding protein [Arthrobacter sp. H14-L1]MCY0903983.1 AMP-binding protein [Arthrobacter sp. H14-L1]